ncbi:MAG: IRE (iron responsive element), partial [Planctomycetota bacterium]
MNRSSLSKKLIYLVIAVALIYPLYQLGRPAGRSSDQSRTSTGGTLSQMRQKYGFAESELGEINPASNTMKLASLGMRSPAATILWGKADEYKNLHQWDRLKATLETIALLQPHYERVWEFQAHNMAYNVSSEFDDFRQRYRWVREGTDYLTRGFERNQQGTRLIWYTGWFYGQKLGMSDEKREFRQLFRNDTDFHDELRNLGINIDREEALGPDGKPDNWLVGRLWLERGYELVDSGTEITRQTPLNFFETGPKWLVKHADAVNREPPKDADDAEAWKEWETVVGLVWQRGANGWEKLGDRSIPTTSPFPIRLGGLDELADQIKEKEDEFGAVVGDAWEDEKQRLLSTLNDDQRVAWETPAEERTLKQEQAVEMLQQYMQPNVQGVAKRAKKNRVRAIELANEI